MDTAKRPRHYADEIAALPTREERLIALFFAPDHLRDLIEKHVIHNFNVKSRKLSGHFRGNNQA